MGGAKKESGQALARLPAVLLPWYDENRRVLPWREEVTPYRTWVSEVMLQQTRVQAALPYFLRFMEAAPDIPALAACEEEKLHKLWEGLGYYSRVRNLQKAARIVCEEYGGEQVTITADFISFVGDAECIRFRSRVFLQADRYASNALIREAIANHDSDKMAEGLKDAGWATSSSYVESLKSTMETYNLYRFDGMSLEDFRSGAVLADAIVSAAYSQLGVPYVWGGTTPGVGLDCSGLTQYCYKQAGISIPRNTEAQYAQGKKIALSEAQPGDILYRMGHVGIYIGGDRYIHAPHRGEVVKIASGISSFTCALSYR